MWTPLLTRNLNVLGVRFKILDAPLRREESCSGDGSDSISANDAVALPARRPIQLVIPRFLPPSVLRRRRRRRLQPLRRLNRPARPRSAGAERCRTGRMWVARLIRHEIAARPVARAGRRFPGEYLDYLQAVDGRFRRRRLSNSSCSCRQARRWLGGAARDIAPSPSFGFFRSIPITCRSCIIYRVLTTKIVDFVNPLFVVKFYPDD